MILSKQFYSRILIAYKEIFSYLVSCYTFYTIYYNLNIK